MSYGILIVSHVEQIAQGVPKLLKQVAPDIAITFAVLMIMRSVLVLLRSQKL